MTRRTVVAATVVAAALAVWAGWIEPRRLLLRRRRLALPGWPPELAGLRVAVLSDLHAGSPQVDPAHLERVVRTANRARPELVLLLGDFVDDESILGERIDLDALTAALRRLDPPLGSFAVLGNHDWEGRGERVWRAVERAGVRVLENDAASVTRRGRRLWIAGLAEPANREVDLGAALDPVPEDEPLLVLTHTPDLFPAVPERASLTLAGHTHGAQVNLPLVRRVVTPSRYGDRYTDPYVVEGGRRLFVHPGIGTSRLPIRLRATPEVTLLVLVPQPSAASRASRSRRSSRTAWAPASSSAARS